MVPSGIKRYGRYHRKLEPLFEIPDFGEGVCVLHFGFYFPHPLSGHFLKRIKDPKAEAVTC